LVTPLAQAHLFRLRALVAIARDPADPEIDADLERATDAFRAFGAPFYLARTLLERAARRHAEAAAALRAEAAEIFASLRAERWVAAARVVSPVG
jgi:hypothetical protein